MAKKEVKTQVKKAAKKVAKKTVKTQKVSVKAVEPAVTKAPTVKIWKYEFDRRNVIAAGVVALVVLLCLVF